MEGNLQISGTYETKIKGKMASKPFPDFVEDIYQMSGGNDHIICLNVEDEVRIYGSNKYGQTKLNTPITEVNTIAAGPDYSVWAFKTGQIVGIGNNEFKQMNIPDGLISGDIKSIQAFPKNLVIFTTNGV